MTKVQVGNRAEFRIYEKLITLGFRDVRMNRSRAPYDLEVDGNPVEVKYRNPTKGNWVFPTRKPGMPVVPVIAYIFCMDRVPGEKDWVFIVLPGPIPKNHYSVSLRSLSGENKKFVNNWTALQPIPYPLAPRKLPKRLYEGSSMSMFGYGGNIPASIAGYIRYNRMNVPSFSRTIGFSPREVQNVIDGIIPPSGDLMYALGARIG